MLELPEALAMSRQLNQTVQGKKIAKVTAAQSAHKLTWYNGDPQKYPEMLVDQTVGQSCGRGAMVEIQAGKATLLFSDGVNLRFHKKGETRPKKHQLLIEFSDGSALSASVQMYGGVVCFSGGYDNKYYKSALEKPAVLSPAFDMKYFLQMVNAPGSQKLSLKALLATEQRIPGLGNGVLQDILFEARIHPKKRVSILVETDKENLYKSIREVLSDMANKGGRDTEKDLFGQIGGYAAKMSSKNAAKPCPVCGTAIKKEAYMGGSVYYCEKCQKL
jgi:formamidopyrimidine-DNA glycosylase